MKMYILTAAVLATLTSTTVMAASEGGDTWSEYGTPVEVKKVGRVVHLGPHSRWVTVSYGETVRFVSQSGNGSERSFDWRFDVSPEVNSVALNKIAPADFPERDVRVYVEADARHIVF
jgi:Heavy-metal resistance protein CzcE